MQLTLSLGCCTALYYIPYFCDLNNKLYVCGIKVYLLTGKSTQLLTIQFSFERQRFCNITTCFLSKLHISFDGLKKKKIFSDQRQRNTLYCHFSSVST